MKKIFFSDFDGTITHKDTVVLMMETFCRDGWQEFEDQWTRKEISSEECARRIFGLMDAGPEDIRELMDNVEIDHSFIPFPAEIKRQGHEFYILSDGYDFLMDHVLERYGLLALPRYTNRLLVSHRPYDIESPYINTDCGRCGVCKTKLIKKLTRPGYQTVYIGDGYSDTCACQKTDIIFAKDRLWLYCQEQGIPAIAYQTFADISRWLEDQHE